MAKKYVCSLLLFFCVVSIAEPAPPATDEEKDLLAYHPKPPRFAVEVAGTWMNYVKYVVNDATGATINQLSGGVRVGFEWMPITTVGKIGLGVGAGFTFASGIPVDVGITDGTFHTLPVDFFLSYRLDYWHNQVIVPYAKFGGEFALISQTSQSGGGRPGTPAYLGIQFAFGGALCLNFLEPGIARRLDSNFGIKNTSLYFEYVSSDALQPGQFPDLSSYQYRIGVRLEI
jgi:hypothetical protein